MWLGVCGAFFGPLAFIVGMIARRLEMLSVCIDDGDHLSITTTICRLRLANGFDKFPVAVDRHQGTFSRLSVFGPKKRLS